MRVKNLLYREILFVTTKLQVNYLFQIRETAKNNFLLKDNQECRWYSEKLFLLNTWKLLKQFLRLNKISNLNTGRVPIPMAGLGTLEGHFSKYHESSFEMQYIYMRSQVNSKDQQLVQHL